MKSFSASIIVACGTALLIAGAYHRHGQTGMFLTVSGCAVGVIGLVAWFSAVATDAPESSQRKS